jgi:hypothetical protein
MRLKPNTLLVLPISSKLSFLDFSNFSKTLFAPYNLKGEIPVIDNLTPEVEAILFDLVGGRKDSLVLLKTRVAFRILFNKKLEIFGASEGINYFHLSDQIFNEKQVSQGALGFFIAFDDDGDFNEEVLEFLNSNLRALLKEVIKLGYTKIEIPKFFPSEYECDFNFLPKEVDLIEF